jgi:flagellar biosynthesis/type III secretory pathway protein FliH
MRADSSQPVEVVADPLVSPGGAVFSTSQGELDGRIETQLEEIEHGLADR